jgi:hypothetical protein
MSITESEAALRAEIDRREEVVRGLLDAVVSEKPSDFMSAFGDEIAFRLQDIVSAHKDEVRLGLLNPAAPAEVAEETEVVTDEMKAGIKALSDEEFAECLAQVEDEASKEVILAIRQE